MILVISTGVLVSIMLAVLSYTSKLPLVLKIVAFSAMITLGLFTYRHYVENLGLAVQGYPPDEFLYVHHELTGETITVWIVKEGESRLYEFPYDRESAKALEEAKKKRGQGEEQQGTITRDNNGQRIIDTEDFAPNHNVTKPEGG